MPRRALPVPLPRRSDRRPCGPSDPLCTGWEAFDALGLLRRGGVTLLELKAPAAHLVLAPFLGEAARRQGVVLVEGLGPPRTLRRLRRWAGRRQVAIVVTCAGAGARQPGRRDLEEVVDEVVRLHPTPQGRLLLRAPRRGLAALVDPPPARASLLDALRPVGPLPA